MLLVSNLKTYIDFVLKNQMKIMKLKHVKPHN